MAGIKTTIQLGFINIAAKYTPAARADGTSFHLLHSTCLQRINMKTVCQFCDDIATQKKLAALATVNGLKPETSRLLSNPVMTPIERADLHKGYEIEKGKYITVTQEEIDGCKPESSTTLEITSTVAANELDPMLFESSYFLDVDIDPKKKLAGDVATKAYALLLATLENTNRYAIAKITMSGREQTVVIRPYNGVLTFHTMFYQNEVRAVPAIPKTAISAKELELAKKLVTSYAKAFEHSEYKDTYTANVNELIESKKDAKPMKARAIKKPARSESSLLDALQASLDAMKKAA